MRTFGLIGMILLATPLHAAECVAQLPAPMVDPMTDGITDYEYRLGGDREAVERLTLPSGRHAEIRFGGCAHASIVLVFTVDGEVVPSQRAAAALAGLDELLELAPDMPLVESARRTIRQHYIEGGASQGTWIEVIEGYREIWLGQGESPNSVEFREHIIL